MQVRTQLAIVGLVAVAWGAGSWVRVHPVLSAARGPERLSLAALEQRVARHRDDVRATRELLQRYLDHGMTQVVVDTSARAPVPIQRDGVVSLITARAHEALGHVETAHALVSGALSRCAVMPPALQEGSGCDVRTVTTLSVESDALGWMRRWHITPASDPVRASVAHEMATRPVRITAGPRLAP